MEKLTNKDFYALSDIFHDLTGIKYSTDKIYLFENRLSKFVGEWGGFSNYNDFINKLKSDPDLRNRFINELTTNFTFFFRESIHFYFLKYIINKKFIKEKEVRIWSAAASGGHEAYSMAISLLGRHNNVSTNFKILATDIATEKIEFAIKGVYKLEEINGYLNKESILKFFNIKNNQYYVKNFLKSHITFKILNLMDPYPFHKKFHIIFLRNVLIYFKKEEKEIILNKVFNVLNSQGFLVISLSESLTGLNVPFKHIANGIYRPNPPMHN